MNQQNRQQNNMTKKKTFTFPLYLQILPGMIIGWNDIKKVLPPGRKNDPYLYRNNLETGRPLDMLRTAVKVTGGAMVASMADK